MQSYHQKMEKLFVSKEKKFYRIGYKILSKSCFKVEIGYEKFIN